MLEKEDFRLWAVNRLEGYLMERGRNDRVQLREFHTVNRSYTGIILEKETGGMCISPVCNTDRLYEAYLQGMSTEEIGRILLSALDEPDEEALVPDGVPSDYESAREKLFLRVCAAEKNRELLRNVPCLPVEDLALTFHLLLKNTDGISSAIVTGPLMKTYGITQDTLLKDAFCKSAQTLPPAFMPLMGAMFGDLEPRPLSELPDRLCEAVILTNTEGIYGASSMFCPGVLKTLSEHFGGDMVILPSSIHEVILLPAEGADIGKLSGIVASVNRTEVPEEDRLTDSVYYYDAACGILTKAYPERKD